jgi:hypothetical protein
MDIFHGRALSPAGPATDIMPVTPNDGADLAITASALFIEIGGIIEIVTVRDETRSVTVGEGVSGGKTPLPHQGGQPTIKRQ